MKNKLEFFFGNVARKITEYLDDGCKLLITAGEKHYTLEIPEKGKVKVHEGKMDADVEIIGDENVIADLFSSVTIEEFADKMCKYVAQGKKPRLRILMDRNVENIKKFIRTYYIPLLKLYIIR
ncbi:MAG: hypothetical protein QXQ94_07370 [Candidatus Bathyarchaeia archaeon]